MSFKISVPSIEPAGRATSAVPVPSVVTVKAVTEAPPSVIEVAFVAPKVSAPASARSKTFDSTPPVAPKTSVVAL